MTDKKMGVIGGGAWGTALATLLAQRGHQTCLWAREEACVEAINTIHINRLYLPDVTLDPRLTATLNLSDLAGCDAVLCVVPAQHTRIILKAFAPYTREGLPIILCSKGIETETLLMMTDVIAEELPATIPAVLSGPSFAIDVAKGLPTAITLACADAILCDELAALIQTLSFRPYTSSDLIGAEIGGAVKNVLAIACGVALGLGLGRSAHAALIARGFAEMTRLGISMGANPSTLTGLCGLGDLVLTCSSEQSRNMSCGYALGQGVNLQTYLAERNSVVEGVSTASALKALSQRHNVDMPICTRVAHIVSGQTDPRSAVTDLLSRPLKSEMDESVFTRLT